MAPALCTHFYLRAIGGWRRRGTNHRFSDSSAALGLGIKRGSQCCHLRLQIGLILLIADLVARKRRVVKNHRRKIAGDRLTTRGIHRSDLTGGCLAGIDPRGSST